jgi:ankyrin repeat protein
MTDIFQAVANNDIETVNLLIKDDRIDINIRDNKYNTPLMYAKSKEMVKLLVSQGADLNVEIINQDYILTSGYYNYEETILTYMFVHSTVEAVETLIDEGAHIYLKDEFEIILLLVMKGFIDEKFIPMYELLYKKGVNFNILDSCGDNVLHYLVPKFGFNNNVLKMISFFINHGVDINQVNNSGEPAIFYITQYHYCGQHNGACRIELLKFFLDNGANFAIKTNNQNTFLHHVIEQSDTYIIKYIKFLLDNDFKSHIDDKNNQNLTAIQLAIEKTSIYEETNNMYYEIIKSLVKNGANIYIKYNDEKTLLYRAIELSNINIVKYLLDDIKMDIHTQDNNGITALNLAIELSNRSNITQNDIKVIKLILKKRKQEYNICILEFYNLLTFLKLSKNILTYVIYNHYLKQIIEDKNNLNNIIFNLQSKN